MPIYFESKHIAKREAKGNKKNSLHLFSDEICPSIKKLKTDFDGCSILVIASPAPCIGFDITIEILHSDEWKSVKVYSVKMFFLTVNNRQFLSQEDVIKT